MAYRIEYFREGREIGTTPWAQSLDDTIRVARDGLVRHQADFARIVDVDGSGAEVWSGRHDA